MKILFDATEISYYLEESGHRAGVFFVALNIFRELKKKVEISICPKCALKIFCYCVDIFN